MSLLFTLEIVSEYKTTLLRSMTVQINIDFQVPVLMLLNDCLLSLIDGWLLLGTWVEIKPIEVVIMRVQTIITSSYAVRINQRYYFKLIFFQQNSGLIGLRHYEVNYSI